MRPAPQGSLDEWHTYLRTEAVGAWGATRADELEGGLRRMAEAEPCERQTGAP